jgi:hypothetical protein
MDSILEHKWINPKVWKIQDIAAGHMPLLLNMGKA